MDLNALLAKQKAKHENAVPTDVEVLLGDRVVTVSIPPMQPGKFFDFVTSLAVVTAQEAQTYGFGLNEAARSYPGIVIRDGEDEDNLLTVIVDGETQRIGYGWPQVYDLLEYEDRESVRAVIWGTYVHGPRQAKAAAVAAAETVSPDPGDAEDEE